MYILFYNIIKNSTYLESCYLIKLNNKYLSYS